MNKQDDIRAGVETYYGAVLQSAADLKTTACCPADALPLWLREPTARVADEIIARSYGCGSPIPPVLEGLTVLDLGCGTGRDCYVLSQLVGEGGRVIGVDMTDEQLGVARSYIDEHMGRFGYKTPNVEFRKGVIEDLASAGLEDNSVDLVISNCVINLSADKQQTFEEIFRVLKPGGELYFSDVYASRRIPEALKHDQVLMGECLAGALYGEDFRRILNGLGIRDYRICSTAPIEVEDPVLRERLGAVKFSSLTIRAFKLDLEDRCEDFGHVARYKGTIPHHGLSFALDDHHLFETGRFVPVCGNTARMVSETRFGAHFEVLGDFSTHYGLFDCGEEGGVSAPDVSAACC